MVVLKYGVLPPAYVRAYNVIYPIGAGVHIWRVYAKKEVNVFSDQVQLFTVDVVYTYI